MNIYERLQKDHDKQRALFTKVIDTEGSSTERQNLWRQIKIELEAHASAEEQTFYAELIAEPEGSDKARHSVAEHQEAADLMNELDDIDMSSPAWLQKMKHLKERVIHHIDEEEKEIFPAAQNLIPEKRAQALTDEFNERKPAEIEKESAA